MSYQRYFNMTDLEDVGARIALEYLKEYCHDRQCDECSLIKLCRIVWSDDGLVTLENAIDCYLK